MEAFNSGNAVAVAELYTEDAAVLPPDGKRVDGRKGVEEFWQGAIKGGMKNLTLKAIEVEERTDLAYEVGAFTLDMPSEGGGLSTVLSTSPYRKSGNVRQEKRGRLEAAAPREKRARRRAPGLSSGPAWASCAV